MTNWQIVFAASLFVLVALALFVAALWRHKRAATGDVDLMGAAASVETALEPEGSVLVRGELWRARLVRARVLSAAALSASSARAVTCSLSHRRRQFFE